jgi:hypothetical protein
MKITPERTNHENLTRRSRRLRRFCSEFRARRQVQQQVQGYDLYDQQQLLRLEDDVPNAQLMDPRGL